MGRFTPGLGRQVPWYPEGIPKRQRGEYGLQPHHATA
jgi:hypothetical protein